MTVARTAARRRQQMANGNKHLAKRGRSVYPHSKRLEIERPKAVQVKRS